VIFVDGVAVAPINVGTLTTFTVSAGRHRLQVKKDGVIPREIDAMRSPLSSLRPPHVSDLVNIDIDSGDSVRLVVNRSVFPCRLEEVEVTAVAAPDPTPTPVTRKSVSATAPEGRVEHSGKWRLELRQVEPVPYVAPGTVARWRATSSISESAISAPDPIRAQVGINTGALSATLSKDFGLTPTRESIEENTRQLELELPGDYSTAWEVRIFDVWQIAAWIRPGEAPVAFEYLSGTSASAHEVRPATA
jgi:hypothetical protein